MKQALAIDKKLYNEEHPSVATGLNTAMDRSKFHHEYDQGWRGNMGLTDYNIANREYSTHVVRPTRKAPHA